MGLFKEAVYPNWEEYDQKTKRIHDWRSYITDGVRVAWFEIPLEGRIAVIEVAQECADREEWD